MDSALGEQRFDVLVNVCAVHDADGRGLCGRSGSTDLLSGDQRSYFLRGGNTASKKWETLSDKETQLNSSVRSTHASRRSAISGSLRVDRVTPERDGTCHPGSALTA